MKLFINLRSSLVIVFVMSFSLYTNAFTLTTPAHQPLFSWNSQRFIEASRVQSKPRTKLFGVRKITNSLNEDMDMANKCSEDTLAPAAIQILKTMMMASMITIGSAFATDVASVSAATIDCMNDVTCNSPSVMLAKGAYVPEAGYDTLDFSMPSYRVDADVAEPIRINDVLGGSTSSGNDDRSSVGTKKASSSSSPNRAEKGALAVAQAKAKKEAAKAEALAKQQALKEKTFDK